MDNTLTRDAASAREKKQTLTEEIANSITHGLGAALGVAALSVLVTLAAVRGDAWRIVSFSIYGTTLIILYLASTLYHSFQHPRVKSFFQYLDHCAIYLLIAGTYTPFALVTLRGGWGWTIFGLIWGLALTGIVLTVFFMNRWKAAFIILYVSMGWLVVIAVKPLLAIMPTGGLIWMLIGGLSYSLGVIFYAWKRLPFNHVIWHLFVLGGSIGHFFGILFYVLPMNAA